MAAYAALVSLMHTIEQLQNHHRPPISLDKSQVEYLTDNISFFLDFLEGCSHDGDTKESDDLKSRIADAAHADEDLIESHIVDQIFEEETSLLRAANHSRFFRSVMNREESICTIDLNNGLHDMDFIKQEVMQIKGRSLSQDHLHRKKKALSASQDSLRSSFTSHNIVMGSDDELIEIMDKLTGPQSNRQIIPIEGMGGIGKPTLAKNAYSSLLIQHHFDICAWIIISQEYNVQEILKQVFRQVSKEGERESRGALDESELSVELHKCLTGRRYLIVMDDMWSIEVWERINISFPEDHRICVSTLIELWVAEGFLKPISGKSLEEVAMEYFKSLVDKNLILVNELGSTGNIKYCNIHDLLRDFCLRQAQNERFYKIMNPHSLNVPQGPTPRCVVFPLCPSSTPEEIHHFISPSANVARSLFYCSSDSPSLQDFRLLRICNRFDAAAALRYNGKCNTLGNLFHLVNLRYFAVIAHGISSFSSSIYRFWNLHTIIVKHSGIMIAPSEFWKMPQLQCVKFSMVKLPDPPKSSHFPRLERLVLERQHALKEIPLRNWRYINASINSFEILQWFCCRVC